MEIIFCGFLIKQEPVFVHNLVYLMRKYQYICIFVFIFGKSTSLFNSGAEQNHSSILFMIRYEFCQHKIMKETSH